MFGFVFRLCRPGGAVLCAPSSVSCHLPCTYTNYCVLLEHSVYSAGGWDSMARELFKFCGASGVSKWCDCQIPPAKEQKWPCLGKLVQK